MKYSIGKYIDSNLQKKIKCFCKEKKNKYKLKEIYESMYDNPTNSLNKTRQNIELLFEEFFNENKLKGNSFQDRLSSSNKLSQSDMVKYFHNKYTKPDANSKLDLIYSHGNLIRVYGNTGSHSGNIENKSLSQMAFISFLSFFELYEILNVKNEPSQTCIDFSNFIYDSIDVVYQTKDDMEEWQRIKYYKFNFQYNLYIGKRKLVKNRIDLTNLTTGTNIYFLYADNNTYNRCRNLYKELNEINENEYFHTDESNPEIEIIDIIPLQFNSLSSDYSYKWDLCYINVSIEFENSGIDLILFLIFEKDKFKKIEDRLEFHSI